MYLYIYIYTYVFFSLLSWHYVGSWIQVTCYRMWSNIITVLLSDVTRPPSCPSFFPAPFPLLLSVTPRQYYRMRRDLHILTYCNKWHYSKIWDMRITRFDVYTYIYVHIFVYIYIYIYIYMYVHTVTPRQYCSAGTTTFVMDFSTRCVRVCVHACVCACVRVCARVCVCTCSRTLPARPNQSCMFPYR